METAAILAGGMLLSALGNSIYQGKQNEAQNMQNAILQKGKADQSASASLLQKQQNALSNLIEAYRGSLMG